MKYKQIVREKRPHKGVDVRLSCCVVYRQGHLRRADHLFKGVLLDMCVCVYARARARYRNLKNEAV